ncbi:MAG: glutathione S-transferase family protein [Sneathiellales bacterium]|nr:glutathione S-transferase family protein [Sneathiellales bacterium]
MKIYEFKGFPNPARVRIALAEKGLLDKVEFVQVNVPGGEHKKPAFLKKNPSGAVPVLETEEGQHISESTAIIEYIDHLQGAPALTGKTAYDRAQIAMVQRKVEAGFLDAVADYFHHATDGLGPDIEKYQNSDWGKRRREVAIATLHWMDEQLKDHDFITGENFSSADITAQAGFLFAGFINLDIPESCPNVRSYADRLMARKSIQQAA